MSINGTSIYKNPKIDLELPKKKELNKVALSYLNGFRSEKSRNTCVKGNSCFQEYLKSIGLDESINKNKFIGLIETRWIEFAQEENDWDKFIKTIKK